jgi:hypothetical protein
VGKVWVRLLTVKQYPNENGILCKYDPGDWLEVGKHDARTWLAAGDAEIPREDVKALVVNMAAAGVIIQTGDRAIFDRGAAYIKGAYSDLEVRQVGCPGVPFAQTLLWDGMTPLRLGLMIVGFHRVSHGWDLAVPLWRYKRLACHLGTEEDQAQTKAIVRDLRMPVYHTGLVYMARNDRVLAFLDEYAQQAGIPNTDPRLAFLRALYVIKPITCALPMTWLAGPGPAEMAAA